MQFMLCCWSNVQLQLPAIVHSPEHEHALGICAFWHLKHAMIIMVCALAMQGSAQMGRRSSREANVPMPLASGGSCTEVVTAAAASTAGGGASSSRSSGDANSSKQRRTSDYLCECTLPGSLSSESYPQYSACLCLRVIVIIPLLYCASAGYQSRSIGAAVPMSAPACPCSDFEQH
jgi:hypothetical protein